MKVHFTKLHEILLFKLQSAVHYVTLYSPYIKKEVIERLTSNVSADVKIQMICSWKIEDLAKGVSDIEVYTLLKKKGHHLFYCPSLHLKTYLFDDVHLLTGSANLTSKGLGICNDANLETLVEVDPIPNNYAIYLKEILKKSFLITDEIYNQIAGIVSKFSEKNDFDTTELKELEKNFRNIIMKKDYFLISELPMTNSPKELYEEILNIKDGSVVEPVVAHDIALYALGQKEWDHTEAFESYLSVRFFSHPFIVKLCGFIDRPRRFGEFKEWVQNNCTNVPVPSRRELTENVQVLYGWLKALGKDKFEYSRPGHSEILEPKKQ